MVVLKLKAYLMSQNFRIARELKKISVFTISKMWRSLPTMMWYSREIINLDFNTIFHRTFLKDAKLMALPHMISASTNPLYRI